MVKPPLDGIRVSIPNTHHVNARAEPSERSAVLAILASSTQVIAVARTADGDWLQILLTTGEQAWVYTEAVIISAERFQDIPVKL